MTWHEFWHLHSQIYNCTMKHILPFLTFFCIVSVSLSLCAYGQSCTLKYKQSFSTSEESDKQLMCLYHRHKHVAITLIRHAITLTSCYQRAPLLLSWQQLIWQTGEFSIVIPEAAFCEMWICSESSEWAKTKLKSTILSWWLCIRIEW